jgi:hypothetical protein
MSRKKPLVFLLILPLLAVSGAAYAGTGPRDNWPPRPQSTAGETVAYIKHYPGYKCVTPFGPHFGMVHIPEHG